MQGASLPYHWKSLVFCSHSFVRIAFELSKIIGREDYMFQMNLELFHLNCKCSGYLMVLCWKESTTLQLLYRQAPARSNSREVKESLVIHRLRWLIRWIFKKKKSYLENSFSKALVDCLILAKCVRVVIPVVIPPSLWFFQPPFPHEVLTEQKLMSFLLYMLISLIPLLWSSHTWIMPKQMPDVMETNSVWPLASCLNDFSSEEIENFGHPKAQKRGQDKY